MDEPWTELMNELGTLVETTGRMLKRKTPLTKQDLTDLIDTLDDASATIQRVRDNVYK